MTPHSLNGPQRSTSVHFTSSALHPAIEHLSYSAHWMDLQPQGRSNIQYVLISR